MIPEPLSDLAKPAPGGLTRVRLAIFSLSVLLLVTLAAPLIAGFLWPGSGSAASPALQLTATPSPFQPSGTPSPTPTANATPGFQAGGSLGGTILLSLSEQGYARLFWHQLSGQPFTRLTRGAWDDIQPAANPANGQVAFASNRSGHWDLYLLDLQTGETTQLSDDPGYDGHPSWSADGAWLAYEHAESGNLEVYIRPADGSIEPVPVSAHAALDYDPAWRTDAQQIAFVSARDGSPQLWLVDLQVAGDARFRLLSPSDSAQASPAWSPDGAWLAWAQQEDGAWAIYAQDLSDPAAVAQRLGLGAHPQWNPSGTAILAELQDPNNTYLTAYLPSGGLALAPQILPGRLEGAAWSNFALSDALPDPLAAAARVTPSAEWAADLAQAATSLGTGALTSVNAPYEEINTAALAPFDALRQRAAQLLGWDALSSLDSAFLPLDYLLPPDRQQDWLYTGRAFELHNALLAAGWMAIVREQVDGQTYWRVYLKTAEQAGGQGRPLTELPWDLAAGQLAASAAGGYWIDFTALAADYGFERLPGLGNWRSYYQGTMFNQFALRAGLTWEEAMLQIYSAADLAGILQTGAP
jgi:TolB protein